MSTENSVVGKRIVKIYEHIVEKRKSIMQTAFLINKKEID